MKIALVVPSSNFLISQIVYPYLGVLYLAAELNNYDVDIVDIGAGDELIFSKYDIIAYTANVTQADEVKKLTALAKIENSNVFQIVGGIWPSITRDFLGADCIILGEGELALKQAIKERKKFSVYTPKIQNIDSIKFPARDKLDIFRYKGWDDNLKTTPIMSSRGCPYSCGFCSKNPYDKFRMRSPKNFIKEVDEIISMGFEGLMIYDDTLNVNRKRFVTICNLLKERNIVWKCHIRADLVDEELIRLMVDSGCIDVAVGFESGSNAILKNINKKTTVELNTKVAKLFSKYGIKVRAYMILGLPGESLETINETRKWLEKGIYEGFIQTFGLGLFMPYPGSPIFENKHEYDIKFGNIDYSNSYFRGRHGEYNCFVETSSLSKQDLIYSREAISREFKEFN